LKLPRLKEVRELHGWSQTKLTEESGVSRDSISNYETGHRGAYPATAKKLADALGVEIADLIEPARELATSGKAEAPPAGPLDQEKLREWFEEVLRAAQPLAEQPDEVIALAREAAERQARGEPPIAAGFVEDEPPERAALEAAFLRFIQEQRERIVEAAREGK
jgi:transcriptional regulator with XRE-family HTH domain